MSVLSATRAMSFRIRGLTDRFHAIVPSAKAATVTIYYTGPAVTRYYQAQPTLLQVVADQVGRWGAQFVPSAVGFTVNATWFVLMGVIAATWGPLTGTGPGSQVGTGVSVGHGPTLEANIRAQGEQVAALPSEARRVALGDWGAPGSRVRTELDYRVLAAWTTFVATVRGQSWKLP